MFGKKRDKKQQQDEQQEPDAFSTLKGAKESEAEPPSPPGGRPMMSSEFSMRPAHEDLTKLPETSEPEPEPDHEAPPVETATEPEPEAPVDEGLEACEDQADSAAEATALIERIQRELAELKGAEAARDEDAQRHAQHEHELQAQLDAQRERHAQLEHERDEARAEAERLRAENESARQSDGRLQELEHVLNDTNERANRLQQQLDESHAEVERLRSEQHQHSDVEHEHRARLDELRGAITSMEDRLAQAETRERAMEERLGEAKRRADEAERRAHELDRQVESREAFDVGPDEFCERRRVRLNGVRSVLRQRADQLYRVKTALEHKAREVKEAGAVRHQAEQMLFEARERRTQVEKAYTAIVSQRAKGATGVFIACLAVAWVALCAGAWFGVGMFVPVEYNAHTSVSCDVRGIPEPDASAAAWTEFATALPDDPMFHERLAQRMKARAYDDLATPGSVRTFLRDHATFDSPAPGTVNVTIRSEGAGRTERVLETLATGIVAYSNETKDRRADGAPAAVVEPAAAESQPVEDPRPAIAAGVAGGLTALLLVVAAGVWRSARKAVIESGQEALAGIDHAPAHYETPPAPEAGGVGMQGGMTG